MLKYYLVIFIFLLTVTPGNSFSEDKITVSIKVEGLKNDTGLCYMLLFKNKKGFPDSISESILNLQKSLINKSAEFTINIIPGTYAISILHDENLNNKLDKTWYGKPVEGIGVSNNPALSFGPPGFQESAVFLKEDKTTLKIIMKYL